MGVNGIMCALNGLKRAYPAAFTRAYRHGLPRKIGFFISKHGKTGENSRKKGQTVCKPGSVRIQSMRGDHSSGMPVTGHLKQPTQAATRKPVICCLYLVLLPAGFTLPLPSPAVRCALTAPFHPYPYGRFTFCGTFPGVASAGRYPAPCFRGARTFLPRLRERDHPTI